MKSVLGSFVSRLCNLISAPALLDIGLFYFVKLYLGSGRGFVELRGQGFLGGRSSYEVW